MLVNTPGIPWSKARLSLVCVCFVDSSIGSSFASHTPVWILGMILQVGSQNPWLQSIRHYEGCILNDSKTLTSGPLTGEVSSKPQEVELGSVFVKGTSEC